ncbi:hypothetical protein [Streptomyces sp. NBC_00328]|uniref:hypothetical protein n=1 Tax=Streptomyces sp. NBC_00328 TaxID=2903646 RepID=UPI002E2C9B01|nr:hypothetical protein [Streptomyces sp. NBC_00328]
MARRTNTSCLGMAVKGYLLLNLWVAVGYALALPVTLPDLMASQDPSLHVQGPVQHAVVYGIPVAAAVGVALFASRRHPVARWVVGARAAGVLVLGQLAVHWAAARFDAPEWSARAMAQCGAAGLTAYLCRVAVRWWDNGGLTSGGRRPGPGEIWHAAVPFRDTEGSKERYCVVMRSRPHYAEVLKITSQNKDHRHDHIRMPSDGWDLTSGKGHWVEIGLQPLRVPYQDFTDGRPKGRCPRSVWRRLQAQHPAPTASRA